MTFPPLTDTPLVSVLMPAYNAERFISEAIQHLLDQTYSHWELLLLNDGSTDGTDAIVQRLSDPRIRTLHNEHNEGYLRACNRLFGEAKGEIITFQDADDTSIPQRLELYVNAFRENAGLGFATTGFCRMDVDGNITKAVQQHPDFRRYATDPEYYPTLCCATIALRKELLDKVGGYHPFFERICGEDYHWLFQLARHAEGTHLSSDTYMYRSHPAQTHLRNSHPLRFFIEDIDRSIRKDILHGNEDPLSHWQELRTRWSEHISARPYELAFRRAGTELNSGNRSAALRATLKIVSEHPLHWKAYVKAVQMLLFIARR